MIITGKLGANLDLLERQDGNSGKLYEKVNEASCCLIYTFIFNILTKKLRRRHNDI